YAQAPAAFSYDLGVRMGTQESAETITVVGTAFWYGFSFGDLVVYIPLLIAGLIGHWLDRRWAPAVLGSALGITVYWPLACLAAIFAARGAPGWHLPNETAYWVVLPLIAVWGAFGLWRVVRRRSTE
ncbi:MAG: hypothetical protein GY949_22085, partial [Gammaproteobacteria bacterium]|nr:hypothetical protein [Gammaproteobacteria bacterium]